MDTLFHGNEFATNNTMSCSSTTVVASPSALALLVQSPKGAAARGRYRKRGYSNGLCVPIRKVEVGYADTTYCRQTAAIYHSQYIENLVLPFLKENARRQA